MSRLTKRNDFGQAYFLHCFKKETCNGEGCSEKCNDCDFNSKITETIAKYEDDEEQGLLLRLPCKIGDAIYVIPSLVNYRLNVLNGYCENNRVYRQVVERIHISQDCYLLVTCDSLQSVLSGSYKKTWFLTEVEAEQALQKMKGGE